MIYMGAYEVGDIWANHEFGGQAIYGLIVGLVGRRYMIYSSLWKAGDIWANRWCGRQTVYDLFESLGGRRYIG